MYFRLCGESQAVKGKFKWSNSSEIDKVKHFKLST